MKTLLLIGLAVMFSSCGKNGNSHDGDVKAVSTINRSWTYHNLTTSSPSARFEEIDFSDFNNVLVTRMQRVGSFQNCTYSVTQNIHNDFYGSFYFTPTSGDPWICSQLSGNVGYEVVFSVAKNAEVLSIAGNELR